MNLSKFILGTAQIGSIYGISNSRKKQISFSEAKKIIKKCKSFGIKEIDTAISYNNDKILGKVGVNKFNVNTKISIIKFNDKKNVLKFYEKKIVDSLRHLKLKRFNSILIHNPNKFKKNTNSELIYRSLIKLKKKKLFKKIGISIYDFDQLKELLHKYKFDVIQLPFNVFDQRLINSDLIKKLQSQKIEIHVRSIFLQGLLLMKKKQIDKKFKRWKKSINLWSDFTQDNRLIKLNTCLNFVLSNSKNLKILIGINSSRELEEIKKIKIKNIILPDFELNNEKKLINPIYWDKLN